MTRIGLASLVLAAVRASTIWAQDALPSWNETASKKTVVAFVEKVTKEASLDFVPPNERIAVFDNDGTLWTEQPIYFQFACALDRVKALGPNHPEWKEKQPFASLLKGDIKGVLASGQKGLLEILAVSHAGMTTEEFNADVREWLKTARHPKWDRRYLDCVYQPMLELLAYLRVNGFKTFIVSGGGVEFIRAFAEETYGIPPEQVVGSSGAVKFELHGTAEPVLVKQPKVEFVDDGPGKPVGINRFIGRRPIMAFGNSDGDQQMLEWTTAGKGARFGLLVHHDDGTREVAYDRQSKIGKLDKALDEAPAKGWTVVSMKDDWKTIFPSPK